VVVVAAGRQEGRRPQVGDELEAQHVAVEPDGAVEVGDLEVDVAEERPGGDGRRGGGLGGGVRGHGVWLLHLVVCVVRRRPWRGAL
jgi:hypothetical protein